MRDWKEHFQGKKITVMGLGLLGRGVGDAQFLAEHGAELIVTDLKSETELAESLEKLGHFSNITYRLGGHDLADFRNRDFILKAAGVPLDSPYIAEARKNGIPIKMSASWFAELASVPVVGVTGTRGKTTTTMMLYDIMRAAGMEVLLGGNVRGVSTLALLDQVTPQSVALMELDSWQCQGWGEARLSPHIAVFTTFMEDHMDYYTKNMKAYFLDKANIFLHHTPGDTLVVSDQVLRSIELYGAKVQSTVKVAKLFEGELLVPGEHNTLNAALALEAARALGIDDTLSLKALKEFHSVEGRLQLVREVNGVKFYNDTTATTPQALLAALQAVGGPQTVVIVGGKSKNIDVDALGPALAAQKYVVYLAGSGTEELGVTNGHMSLKAAFDEARAHAAPGDTVLLSPGFSSKGVFVNEYDRGDQFLSLVESVPDLSLLKPKVRVLADALIRACKQEGIPSIISRGFRSKEEQDALYARGRTQPGDIVTYAEGGSSFHNYGVAFDVRPAVPDEEKEAAYRKIGVLGEALGLEWGGRWKGFVDPPHFQYPAGHTVEDFKAGRIDETRFLA